MGQAALAYDQREIPRDEVHFRARAFGPDAQAVQLLIVNMSARGLMARCDREFAVGARLRIKLPIVDLVVAEVRWSLGGRLGGELDEVIPLADYYELLSVMLKSK